MKVKLSRTAYQEIEHRLRTRIRKGDWPVGAALPSCQTLATEYDVAVGTVHMAIRSMVSAKLVRSVPGRGTFVTGTPSVPDPPIDIAKPLRVAIVAGIAQPDTPLRKHNGIATLVPSLERSLGLANASIIYCSRNMGAVDWEPFTFTLKRIDWQAIDGVMLVGVAKNLEAPDDLVQAARMAQKPLVCLTSGELPGVVPHVFSDNTFAGYQACRHLLDKGFQQITYFAPFRSSWAKSRFDGVRQAFDEASIDAGNLHRYPVWDDVPSVDELGRVTFDMTFEAARKAATTLLTLLTRAPHPRAVIAMNDAAALAYIDAANAIGMRAGVDYVIAAFDNTEESREAGLTSMQPPWETIADEACRLLLANIRNQHTGTQVRVRSHLVPRASTAITNTGIG